MISIKTQKKLLLTFVLGLLSFFSNAQEKINYTFSNNLDEHSYLFFNENDTSKLSLKIRANTFFKNNEYFGDFIKGYTLIGYMLQPELFYRPIKKLEISLLWNVLQYSGYDKFSDYKPYFRIKYSPTPKFSIIIGRMDGNVAHRLIEPIYNPERYFLNNIENGLQFNYQSTHYNGDLWLNWEKFLLWNDPWQERLTVGHKSEFLLNPMSKTKVSIAGEFLVSHRGGQIDLCDDPVQTLENGAIGFEIRRTQKNVSYSYYSKFAQYHAIDPTPDVPYIDGYGIYNKLFIKFYNFGFICGHWWGDMFMNFRGDPLFSSQAIFAENNKNKRAILFNELFYAQKIHGIFSLKASVNTYYNLYNGDLEYAYMLSFVFNQIFSLSKK